MGDYVLKELSSIVLNNIRDSDSFGRWGGEEFILILPEIDKEHAMQFTKKLRETVAIHEFKGTTHITVSIGVSIFKKNDTKDKLLKRVDNALYLAKNEGRNTVRFQ